MCVFTGAYNHVCLCMLRLSLEDCYTRKHGPFWEWKTVRHMYLEIYIYIYVYVIYKNIWGIMMEIEEMGRYPQ